MIKKILSYRWQKNETKIPPSHCETIVFGLPQCLEPFEKKGEINA
jgi:hypothetical protein